MLLYHISSNIFSSIYVQDIFHNTLYILYENFVETNIQVSQMEVLSISCLWYSEHGITSDWVNKLVFQ